MTDNWYINSSLKEVIDKNLQTLKATNRLVDEKTDPIKERVTHVEDKIKDLTKERSTIENDRLKEMVENLFNSLLFFFFYNTLFLFYEKSKLSSFAEFYNIDFTLGLLNFK